MSEQDLQQSMADLTPAEVDALEAQIVDREYQEIRVVLLRGLIAALRKAWKEIEVWQGIVEPSARERDREKARADELESERDEARTKLARAEEDGRKFWMTMEKLVDKLETVHADIGYESVWTFYMLHGNTYTGPTYEAELNAAKEVLGEGFAMTPEDRWEKAKLTAAESLAQSGLDARNRQLSRLVDEERAENAELRERLASATEALKLESQEAKEKRMNPTDLPNDFKRVLLNTQDPDAILRTLKEEDEAGWEIQAILRRPPTSRIVNDPKHFRHVRLIRRTTDLYFRKRRQPPTPADLHAPQP